MSAERQPPLRFVQSGSRWEELAGYSRAVIDGDYIFVSGTVGQDFRTGIMPSTAHEQAGQALSTITVALAEVGAALEDVVRVRVYVPDRDDVVAVSTVLRERFGGHRPTNTTICAPLAVEGAKVEIEVTARCRR